MAKVGIKEAENEKIHNLAVSLVGDTRAFMCSQCERLQY